MRLLGIETKSIGIETEVRYETELQDIEEKKIKSLKNQIKSEGGFDSIKAVIDIGRKWPENAYKSSKVAIGLLLEQGKDWDQVVFADLNEAKDGGLIWHFHRRFPEVVELLKESEVGEVEYIIQANESSKSGIDRNKRYYFVAPRRIDKRGINDAEILYNHVLRLREAKKTKREKIAVADAEGLNRKYLRKIVEAIFCNKSV